MRPKDIGTQAESAVVKYLRENGFGGAERRALRGTLDCGDITGCGPVVIEVKAGAAAMDASDGLINAWLAETETERKNAKADLGVLVVRRRGKGDPGSWWAIQWQIHPVAGTPYYPVRYLFKDYVTRLRINGYGDEL